MTQRVKARDLAPGMVNASNGDVLTRTYTAGNVIGLTWKTVTGDIRRHHDAPGAVYTIR